MYAKLNPGLCYIQGMNELIAPLYFLFKHDPDPQARQYAEADAFWCFMELISEFRDHFCAQLDNAQTGIKATIRRLMTVLQACDYKLWQHIEVTCKVDPQYYAFRWITLLLAQEFPFPDTLRTWDTILGDPHGRMDCLLRICTAMILGQKERLMQGDFTVIMKTLQRYPLTNLEALLQKAASLPSCKDILGSSP
ncbi:RabGAP/TBC protein [Haematococcus lacustris]|uniref:RabGAP/TBC protein n=1 Tax=Haematococcus lacustris TaxID=44745 RepID=A0A699ZSW1_HAELA|nr:RabGAP/TBC protein [Haematococcus lacustris]